MTEKRLIDADEFILDACARCNIPYGQCVGCALSKILSEQPTVDAVEEAVHDIVKKELGKVSVEVNVKQDGERRTDND